jgi:transcriptional regulator with XRE-family HTH domain
MPRKLSKPRPRQGARLAALRRTAGLTQAELAELVGETQRNIAYWEQADKPPRSDVIPRLASVLGVKVDTLLSPDGDLASITDRTRGPVGKARKAFEDVSRLPRRQQDKILEIVEAFVAQHSRKAG